MLKQTRQERSRCTGNLRSQDSFLLTVTATVKMSTLTFLANPMQCAPATSALGEPGFLRGKWRLNLLFTIPIPTRHQLRVDRVY